MKSLCFFVSYIPLKRSWLQLRWWRNTGSFHEMDLPYIEELQKYFDKVIVITNVKPKNDKFEYLILPNRGYDFGYFYRAINQTDMSKYNFLGLINNSNILLKNKSLNSFFSWCKLNDSNFCGITDSFEKTYHIQSHFLIFKNNAINLLIEYFKDVEFEKFFLIKNKKKLRHAIINEVEIGLSQFMIRKGLKVASWFKADKINSKYNKSMQTNIHVFLWEELIKEGYPLMKKKIVQGEWENIIPNPWNKQIYL